MADNENSVEVFASGNPALIAVAQSILDDAEITYSVWGENSQHLFGFGSIGTGYNLLTGPVRIMVMPEDEQSARALLSDVTESGGDDEGDAEENP
jgi:hypothetical protein